MPSDHSTPSVRQVSPPCRDSEPAIVRSQSPSLVLGWVIGLLLNCLPVSLSGQVLDGYTIYNLIGNRTTYLKDNSGQIVRSWSSPYNGYISYLLPDSTVWRMEVWPGSIMRDGPYGGLMQHYTWNGAVIENFLWSDSFHQQHHDINVMPNGNVLLVSWDRKTRAQGESLGRVGLTGEIWPDEIIEWDPRQRAVVWEWHLWDHLIQDVDPTKPNYGVVRDHPELLDINVGPVTPAGDWTHVNTVDYNAERDEIIITSHNTHEFYVIDHSTTTEEARGHTGGRHGKGGDFIYRWGNPQNYRRGTAADRVFYVTHGANWIRPGMPGAGNILVLNNGDRPGTSGDSSSVLEITPPLDSHDHYHIHPDSAFGPRLPVWSYSNGRSFYSQHLGGAYRLSNGNTFAILGTTGTVYEITPDRRVVWTLNVGGQIGRAFKYPREFATGIGLTQPVRIPNLRVQCPTLAHTALPITLNCELAQHGRITLRLYNALGHYIGTLATGLLEAGSHTLTIQLPVMPPGIYILQLGLQTDSGGCWSETARIVLAR